MNTHIYKKILITSLLAAALASPVYAQSDTTFDVNSLLSTPDATTGSPAATSADTALADGASASDTSTSALDALKSADTVNADVGTDTDLGSTKTTPAAIDSLFRSPASTTTSSAVSSSRMQGSGGALSGAPAATTPAVQAATQPSTQNNSTFTFPKPVLVPSASTQMQPMYGAASPYAASPTVFNYATPQMQQMPMYGQQYAAPLYGSAPQGQYPQSASAQMYASAVPLYGNQQLYGVTRLPQTGPTDVLALALGSGMLLAGALKIRKYAKRA